MLRACVNAHRAKFSHVHLLASVVAGLSAYHDQLGVRLVDLLLERIREGLGTTLVEFCLSVVSVCLSVLLRFSLITYFEPHAAQMIRTWRTCSAA